MVISFAAPGSGLYKVEIGPRKMQSSEKLKRKGDSGLVLKDQ